MLFVAYWELNPEFPSLLSLPLFMMVTLLAIIVYRRRHTENLGITHILLN